MQHVKSKIKKQTSNVIPFIPNGDFYFTKCGQAFKQRKFELALKWMKKAVEAAPDNPLFLCQLSVIYTEIGLYQEANQLLTNVVETMGDNYIDCYYLMANNYAHLGLMNDAKKYARYYLDKEPDGDFSEEAFDLLELLKMDEDEWDLIEDDLLIYQETIFNYMENLEWEKALLLLEELTMRFPEHKISKHDIALCLFRLGKKEEANQMELDLLNEEDHALYSPMNLAVFYYEEGIEEEYESFISALLNIYPIHEHQKLRLATTLAQTGYYHDAYKRFNTLVKGMVNSHLSYYRWFSLASYQLGNKQKAHQIWEEGCLKHPNLQKEATPWLV